jgi:RNA-binding protein
MHPSKKGILHAQYQLQRAPRSACPRPFPESRGLNQQNGLSESVVKEINASLTSHELIKIRVYSDDRELREQFLATICQQLNAAPIQHIGKLLVLWRPQPDTPATPAKPRPRRPGAAPEQTQLSG